MPGACLIFIMVCIINNIATIMGLNRSIISATNKATFFIADKSFGTETVHFALFSNICIDSAAENITAN